MARCIRYFWSGFTGAALALAFLANPAASADDSLKRAINAVKASSNEQLIAEFQRRALKSVSRGVLKGLGETAGRGPESPLSGIDGVIVISKSSDTFDQKTDH